MAETGPPETGGTTKRKSLLPSFITLNVRLAILRTPVTRTEGQPRQVAARSQESWQSTSVVQLRAGMLEQVLVGPHVPAQSRLLAQEMLWLATQNWQSEFVVQVAEGLLEQSFGPVRTAKAASRVPNEPQASPDTVQSLS